MFLFLIIVVLLYHVIVSYQPENEALECLRLLFIGEATLPLLLHIPA